MLPIANASPRRANGSEGSIESDNYRGPNTSESTKKLGVGNYAMTNQINRDNFHNQYQQQRQPRNMFKTNMQELPYYFPPLIQDHGRWETADYGGIPAFNGPRFAPQRRGLEKEPINLQSLPVLKQPQRNILAEDLGDPVDYISDDKYRAQLRSFPDLPAQAHEKIRELGNEIVACYPSQLCKFYNDSLIETTPNSFAVFTKKSRTGQRWLMVFRHDRGRVTVKYNKLLTNQLVVRCLNPVSIEVEPARMLGTGPQETCVFTFTGHSEANKFIKDIQESQSIAWNHREVLLEQSMRNQEHYMGSSTNYGYFPPRPLSARCAPSGYMGPMIEIPPPLTPRNMKVLPPVQHPHNRPKRSPFTVSARGPRADLDDNWRSREALSFATENEYSRPATPSSVIQSPIRKRSKGASSDSSPTCGIGGDGDFVYNSLTHAMALQQNLSKNLKQNEASEEDKSNTKKEVSNARRFQASDVLVSNKRDVGTGSPDEEFSSLGSGEIHLVDNGDDQFDEVKCYASDGQLMFSQILYGWNKVRNAEGSQNPKIRWWIGAAVIGSGTQISDTPRIREFKATFANEESAIKFVELFQEGAKKGNNPEVRKKYLAQSLRV